MYCIVFFYIHVYIYIYLVCIHGVDKPGNITEGSGSACSFAERPWDDAPTEGSASAWNPQQGVVPGRGPRMGLIYLSLYIQYVFIYIFIYLIYIYIYTYVYMFVYVYIQWYIIYIVQCSTNDNHLTPVQCGAPSFKLMCNPIFLYLELS